MLILELLIAPSSSNHEQKRLKRRRVKTSLIVPTLPYFIDLIFLFQTPGPRRTLECPNPCPSRSRTGGPGRPLHENRKRKRVDKVHARGTSHLGKKNSRVGVSNGQTWPAEDGR